MRRVPQKVAKPAVNVGHHASGNVHFTIYGDSYLIDMYADIPDDVDITQYIQWELKEGESWDEDIPRFVRD